MQLCLYSAWLGVSVISVSRLYDDWLTNATQTCFRFSGLTELTDCWPISASLCSLLSWLCTLLPRWIWASNPYHMCIYVWKAHNICYPQIESTASSHVCTLTPSLHNSKHVYRLRHSLRRCELSVWRVWPCVYIDDKHTLRFATLVLSHISITLETSLAS